MFLDMVSFSCTPQLRYFILIYEHRRWIVCAVANDFLPFTFTCSIPFMSEDDMFYFLAEADSNADNKIECAFT